MPDGINSSEFVNVLQRLLKTGKASGMSISIFNPTLDWDGSLAKKIVELISASLR
jgi:arginase